jgi:hypothetical protein
MAGYFSATGTSRALGNTARAVRNIGLGTTVSLYGTCWTYYGGGASNVGLSNSFAGRYYPYTY